MRHGHYLLVLLLILITIGCSSNNKKAPKSLVLTLSGEGSEVRIAEAEVLNRTYKSSRRQGKYMTHLVDEQQNVIGEIGFDKMSIPGNKTGNVFAKVVLPMKKSLNQVKIYKLDGSSGHYQLDKNDPLLRWPLPDSIRHKTAYSGR